MLLPSNFSWPINCHEAFHSLNYDLPCKIHNAKQGAARQTLGLASRAHTPSLYPTIPFARLHPPKRGQRLVVLKTDLVPPASGCLTRPRREPRQGILPVNSTNGPPLGQRVWFPPPLARIDGGPSLTRLPPRAGGIYRFSLALSPLRSRGEQTCRALRRVPDRCGGMLSVSRTVDWCGPADSIPATSNKSLKRSLNAL